MIDLEVMRVFVQVSELNSFTKAAVVLGVTQPTVSRTIKELEDTWGGPLFYRTGRGVAVSELGKFALARARSLLREANQLSEDVRTYSRLPTGNVSFALPHSAVSAVVPELVMELRRDMPGIRLRIYEGFTDQIERWLSSGEVDVAAYSKYREGDSLDDSVLLASYMRLTAPPTAPPMPAQIDFAELANYSLVLPALPNRSRAHFEAIARSLNISLNVIVDTDSIVTQKRICEQCGCYMITAPISGFPAEDNFATSLIVHPAIQRYVVLETTHSRPLSQAARVVADRVAAILTR